MSVFCDETPAQTSIQNATSGDTPDKISGGQQFFRLQKSTSLDPAAATKAWLNSVPQDKREKSDAYFEGGYWLLLWNYLLAAAISILLLAVQDFSLATRFLGTTNEVENAAGRLLHRSVFVARFCLKLSAKRLRALLSRASIRIRHTKYPAWFREQFIGLGITLIGGTIFFVVLYAVFRQAPKTWWIWGTAVAVVSSFFCSFIAPVFIEPIFNTYKPLTKPEVSEPILVMARANQIPVKQVFEVDASRQTTRVSANVSGILGTTRIAADR